MAYGYGERFDRARHSQGTEVKAITMADGLKIEESEGRVDCHILVDI